MRFLILLFLLSLPFAPAEAQENSAAAPEGNAPMISVTRGALPNDKQIIPGTPSEADLAEANHVYSDCAMDERESSYYDCKCTSVTFLQLRQMDTRDAYDRPTPAAVLIGQARQACPNPTGIAGETYTRCLDWAPRIRNDYEEFCACYANDYAKRFAYAPTSSIKMNQWMMTASMNQCNAAQPIIDRIARKKQIEMMKKNGTYEALFPSAKDLNKPIVPVAPPLPNSKRSVANRMSGTLFQEDTGPQRTE